MGIGLSKQVCLSVLPRQASRDRSERIGRPEHESMDVTARTGIWDRRDRQDSQNNSKDRRAGEKSLDSSCRKEQKVRDGRT